MTFRRLVKSMYKIRCLSLTVGQASGQLWNSGICGLFLSTVTRITTHYGPVFEIWFDGANGGMAGMAEPKTSVP